MNAQCASKGIHVAHIVIDGAVDAPDTLGKMLGPERFQALREKKCLDNDALLVPAEVANTYYHLAHQHRLAWTFKLDLRAHSDLPWWNHAHNPDIKQEHPMLKLHHARRHDPSACLGEVLGGAARVRQGHQELKHETHAMDL